jgi:hypothetical protein
MRFWVNLGNESASMALRKLKDISLGPAVVITLLSDVEQGSIVCVDRLFSNVRLARLEYCNPL